MATVAWVCMGVCACGMRVVCVGVDVCVCVVWLVKNEFFCGVMRKAGQRHRMEELKCDAGFYCEFGDGEGGQALQHCPDSPPSLFLVR